MSNWLKELKAGDEVCVEERTLRTYTYTLHKVQKITPKGFIKVKDNLYKPDTGYLRTQDDFYFGSKLLNPKDEKVKAAITAYQEKKTIRMVKDKIQETDLTIEQAERIKEIMRW